MLSDRWNYIDRNGDLMADARYDDATDFHGGIALVWVGKQRFVIDTAGKTRPIE